MKTIKHKFLNHKINPITEILIIGTFNPDTPGNGADFFYGRGRNFLWKLLPLAFNEPDLKGANKEEKINFIGNYKIDLIDLISEIEVEDGQETNYNDAYIDSKVVDWRDVISEIDKLPNLKRVCFTRKTLSGVPNMRGRIVVIQEHCSKKGVFFKALTTPARFYSQDKQKEWSDFFQNK
jgi:G:T/U-mismatch repair DNA glycosylase